MVLFKSTIMEAMELDDFEDDFVLRFSGEMQAPQPVFVNAVQPSVSTNISTTGVSNVASAMATTRSVVPPASTTRSAVPSASTVTTVSSIVPVAATTTTRSNEIMQAPQPVFVNAAQPSVS
ncbi:PREDICTED: uncharacterized protein LOC105458631, partial [Wasmannia auropunctata]|uniref:uncharacterized protein LOC105458631 n=1 Tax=Wasmannia auropunctata TaxID=64793 RepID=UPI0005F02D7A